MPTSNTVMSITIATTSGEIIDCLAENVTLTVEQMDGLVQEYSMEVTLSPDEARALQYAFAAIPMEVDFIDFRPDTGRTTVHWMDGTITTVRCAKGTEFDEYTAFTAALAKRLYGNNSAIRRMIHKKDSREIDRKQKEANLKAQAERERVAAKRRKERIKRMARKMKEEAEARKLAGIE